MLPLLLNESWRRMDYQISWVLIIVKNSLIFYFISPPAHILFLIDILVFSTFLPLFTSWFLRLPTLTTDVKLSLFKNILKKDLKYFDRPENSDLALALWIEQDATTISDAIGKLNVEIHHSIYANSPFFQILFYFCYFIDVKVAFQNIFFKK